MYYSGEVAVIRYIGGFDLSEGTWLGLELKRPCEQHVLLVSMTTIVVYTGGKNDGSVQGKRYFTWSVTVREYVIYKSGECQGLVRVMKHTAESYGEITIVLGLR